MEEASKQLIKISAEMAEVKSARNSLQAKVDSWVLSDEVCPHILS